ncbi:MAG: Hpt domain-containing protein, partial [Desulfobacterales bacterium]|nr:Hpt domain-containing protein [Desulfobacterales bacterium]
KKDEVTVAHQQEQSKALQIEFPDTLAGIDVVTGLNRISGNKNLFRRLLIDYGKTYASVSEEIKEFIDRGELDQAKRKVHEVKGLSGNLSIVDVSVAAKELEYSLARMTGDCYLLLSNFQNALGTVLESIKELEFIEEETSQTQDNLFDPDRLDLILKEMTQLLKAFDIEAGKLLEPLKKNSGNLIPYEDFQKLEKCIFNFDYRQALTILQKISDALNIFLMK